MAKKRKQVSRPKAKKTAKRVNRGDKKKAAKKSKKTVKRSSKSGGVKRSAKKAAPKQETAPDFSTVGTATAAGLAGAAVGACATSLAHGGNGNAEEE